jgi:aspartate carbamoyltransferase catalytic subunit
VARSQVSLLKRLGAEFAICAPQVFMPPEGDAVLSPLPTFEHIDDAMAWCNVLSLLRIQRERISGLELPSVEAYRERYAFTTERAAAFPDLLVTHPGPVNSGVELDEEVLDLPNVLIHRQVTHGVAVRMAILKWVLTSH